MAEDLKEKTISGMLWSSVGKFGTLGLTFISNLVLARLLMPSDYGCIGMLHVFIAISSIFVSAGFGSALVQKKKPTHIDYTSVFYWNLSASIIFYWILFFCGPAIARFYSMPELCPVLRVQSLSLIIQAFSTVQSCQLQKQIRFKELSMRNLLASFVGTVVAITLAFFGFGVWSLVWNNIVASACGVILLWKMSEWRPTWEFSWQSLKELFSFGGLMALSSFMETLYGNILSLILGKWYSSSDLGYYTQARKLEQVPTEAMGSIVSSVSFPVFSTLQDDIEKLRYGVRKNIKSIMYLNIPLMFLLCVIADPLIHFLYGAKWESSILYFQLLCLGGALYTLNSINVNVIKALGKSNIFFFTQLTKRAISLLLIIAVAVIGKKGIIDGVLGLVAVLSASFYLNAVINAIVNKRLIGYGIADQFKDIFHYFLISGVIAIITIFVGRLLTIHPYLVMLVQCSVFVLLYWLSSVLFNLEGYSVYLEVLKNKVIRKRK